ncbi:MAG TPA: hypothetical protein VGI67_19655 [Thermoleophilaceae bacterium]|jgi:hypothetical protein
MSTTERREPDDSNRRAQPRYKSLVKRGPREYYLTATLPSGEPVEVKLGPGELGQLNRPR